MTHTRPMTIRFSCHKCGKGLKVDDRSADKMAACPKCGQHLVIPRESILPKRPPEKVSPPVETIVIPATIIESQVVKSSVSPLRRRPASRVVMISVAAILAAAFAAIVGFVTIGNTADEPPPAAIAEKAEPELAPVDLEQLKRDGLAFAQKRLEKGLKAPKTAEFSAEPEFKNSPLGDSEKVELYIDSHVDAQNSYGVPLRETWSATIIYDRRTREWSVFSLKLGDNYIEIAPAFQKLVTTLQTALEEGRAKRHANAIAHWTGTGTKKTELFRAPAGAWKVSYECDGNPFLSISISRPGTSYYENPISESDATCGEYVVRRTGEFQLDINSSGGTWYVWVEPEPAIRRDPDIE